MMKNKYEKLDKEQLIQLIEKIESRKKYGIVWEEEVTPEDSVQLLKRTYPYLKYNADKSIVKGEDAPNFVLIEGDNYHALTCLYYSRKKSIDLIYIDPPYNIGSKDFVYNDDYVDKEDTYKHSKWLSFMEKRLRLAKRLLKDDGCIFISINEEELAQLKMLCDDIFGEKNYLTMFTIKVRHEERILTGDKDYQEVVEYLLMYRRSDQFKTIKIRKDHTSIDEYQYDIQIISDQPHEVVEWDNKKVEIYTEDQYVIHRLDPDKKLLKRYNIRGTLRKSNTSGRFYVKHIEPKYKDKPGYLFKVENMGDDGLGYRYFLSPPAGRVNGDYFQGYPLNSKDVREIPYPNYMDFEKEFNTVGYEGGVDFKNGKKPIAFLMKIFEIGGLIEKENAIVLDFFGGSGSTAHALMAFNEIHSGNRQAILCQKNKEVKINVVDEVTLPRMKNILHGYTLNRKEEFLLDEIKLDKGNIQKVPQLLESLEKKKIEIEKLGLYDEVHIDFVDQALKLFGMKKKSTTFEGYYANLRYFDIHFIESDQNPDQLKKEVAENSLGLLSVKNDVYDLYKETESYIILKTHDRAIGLYYEMFGMDMESFVDDLKTFDCQKWIYVFTPDPFGIDVELFDELDAKIETIPSDIIEAFQEVRKIHDSI